jgi:hypothetical protein
VLLGRTSEKPDTAKFAEFLFHALRLISGFSEPPEKIHRRFIGACFHGAWTVEG